MLSVKQQDAKDLVSAWEGIAIFTIVTFLAVLIYFIVKSKSSNQSATQKIRYFLIVSLLFQLVSIIVIGNGTHLSLISFFLQTDTDSQLI